MKQWKFHSTPDEVRAASGLDDMERELFEVMNLIVAEFESDPLSVQCFDLRTVERAKAVAERYRKVIRQYLGSAS